MTSPLDKSQGLIHFGIGAGAMAAVLYPIGLLDLISPRVSQLAFMAFGPCFAVAAYGMRAFYARADDSASNDVGHLLLVLAGMAFTAMATMQMSMYTLVPAYARAAAEPDATTWSAILRGVSTTQLGLDFAFDLFVSAGAAFVGWQMVRHPRVPAFLGWLGITIGVAGLALNAITFPENAGEAGLVDPAPFFGVWFTAAWLPLVVWRTWQPTPERA